MRRLGVGKVVAAVVGAVVFVQCGGRHSNSSDTNTSWLARCDHTRDCSGALECVSGVCTRRCSVRADCAGFGADAVCSSAVSQDSKACTLACRSVAECPGAPDAWSCQTEECIPVVDPAASSPAEGGAGGSASVEPSTGGSATGGNATGGSPTMGGNSGRGGTLGMAGSAGGSTDQARAGQGSAGEDAGGNAGEPAGGNAGEPAGGRTGESTGGSTGGPTGGTGAVGGGAGGSSGLATAGAAGQGGAECAALSQAISTETSGAHACTAVVRLGYETRAILGFELLCAPYSQVDEATARQTAYDDTGYGLGGMAASGEDPEDEYVFYQTPGDFGGVGVVSVRNGITVFGGSIIWNGTGEITYPTAWRPASEIGPGCVPEVNALPPTARGIDLSGGQGEMDQARVDAAVNQVWATALPDGMWLNQYVFDAMVLLYPRSVGMMNPATAEWIVLINFGWLE